MKKQTLTLALGLSMIMGTGVAAANPFDYSSAGIAQQNYSNSDIDDLDLNMESGTSIILAAGKHMPNLHERFSVEGEFGYTLSGPSASATQAGITLTSDTTIMTLGGYGVYSMPLMEKLSFKGRAGLVYHSASTELSGSACDVADCASYTPDDDTGVDLAYGVGLNYQLNSKMDIYSKATFAGSSTLYGLGIDYSF